MTNRRWRGVLVGGAGLAGLVLLVLGPPAALAHFVGWPLPRQVPEIDDLSRAMRGDVDDQVIVKALAVLAWLIWAQLAIAAVVEVVALVRGRTPGRAPVMTSLQLTMARLVTWAALVTSAWGPQRPAPVPVGHIAAAMAQPLSPMEAAEPPPADTEVAVRGDSAASPPVETYVVARNDSWWGIAERTSGDGQRWKALRDLNVGRVMADGTVIAADTDIMRPGWELSVPAAPQANGTKDDVATEDVEVMAGDNLWAMTERRLGEARGGAADDSEVHDAWLQVIDANRDRFVDPTNPSLIYPGQSMRMPVARQPSGAISDRAAATQVEDPVVEAPNAALPPTPLPPPPEPESPPSPSTTTTSVLPASPGPPPPDNGRGPATGNVSEPRHPEPDGKKAVPVQVLGVGATMLAVGVTSVVTRHRRRRQLRLPRGTKPPVPAPELDRLRSELAVAADLDHATRLHRALRDVAAALSARRSTVRPRLVQVDAQHIEVLLSEPLLPAPSGWKPLASGRAWVLHGSPNNDEDDAPAPLPTLVTVGRPEEATEVYLDLEGEGVVALVGDDEVVSDVARSWVLELATSPLASGVSVLVVGDSGLASGAESGRVSTVDSWDDVADDTLAWMEQGAALLRARRWLSPVVGRIRDRVSDDLAPLVVVTAGRPDDSRFDRVCAELSERQVPVAVVVVGGGVEGATLVEVKDGDLRIPSLNLHCQPQALTPSALVEVDDLLEEVSRDPVPGDEERADTASTPSPVSAAGVGEPDAEILVRLLGDIAVVGGEELKAKQKAALVYIALHAPVASERVEDALWVSPTASRRKRLANTVSECRRAIGATHLPLATDGRYRVGPGVVTDLELFEHRVAAAALQDDLSAATTLRSALELVQGPVFTYRSADRSSYAWVDVENWISTWELKVTDLAEDLAQRCLGLGDIDAAIWAAHRGLKASAIHGRLIKLLIEAHLARGDFSAAERVATSHQAALHKLELDDDDDQDVFEFYLEARRQRRATTR